MRARPVPLVPLPLFAVALVALLPDGAEAARLEPDAAAPLWIHLGAGLLLIGHVGGGLLGMVAGVVAVAAPKGARVHRAAGRLFLWSMGVAYLVGAGVAPFLQEGQRPNFIAAVLALYLLLTGIAAARRRAFAARAGDVMGLVVPMATLIAGVTFMVMGAHSESGTVDGSPPAAFVMFVLVGAFALYGDLNVLLRRELDASMRTARHLWRMCTSFFLASGSLFLGQPQVFPAWFNGSPLPTLLAFAPLMALAFWMAKTRVWRPWQARRAGGGSTSLRPSTPSWAREP
jgi:uncharacterized membrane protein